jgi:hypothetical protein
MTKPSESAVSSNALLLFASAFGLGAFFTYLHTDTGSRKWRELSDKWEQAKDYLYQQGLITDPTLTLADFKRDYLHALSTSFASMKAAFEQQTIQKELAAVAKLHRRRTRSRKLKFKGV